MKRKLLAYLINGKAVGAELESWHTADLNGNPPFKLIFTGDTVPTGYTDISSIQNWDLFGDMAANDYLVYKSQIKYLVQNIGWSGLTTVEKDIAIRYYAYLDSTDAVIYLMQEKGLTQHEAKVFLIHKWHLHHRLVIESCQQRWYYVKYVIPLYLSFADCEDALANQRVMQLITQLLDLGLLGTEAGDSRSGIVNFLESTGEFANNGLREMGYTLLEGTWEEFITNTKNVLLEGIYDMNENDDE